ncbi:hypothetical protein pipiens_002715 [Culex pipiens pipiens]|uniref:Uncharacterized protein n=1 Tax=Culex pipiens pipiens TaxID=38569 RepID=A0ABD1D9P0_CULPP
MFDFHPPQCAWICGDTGKAAGLPPPEHRIQQAYAILEKSNDSVTGAVRETAGGSAQRDFAIAGTSTGDTGKAADLPPPASHQQAYAILEKSNDSVTGAVRETAGGSAQRDFAIAGTSTGDTGEASGGSTHGHDDDFNTSGSDDDEEQGGEAMYTEDDVQPPVNDLNVLFQSEHPKVYTLNTEFERLFTTILDLFMLPEYVKNISSPSEIMFDETNMLDSESVYVGLEYNQL